MKNKLKNKKEIWLAILIFICLLLLINPISYGPVGEKIVVAITIPSIIGSSFVLMNSTKSHKHNKDCNCVCDEEECKKES